MDPVDKPIVVDPNVHKAQASTLGRDLLLIASVVPALIAVLGTRDVNKIVGYVSSTEFAPIAGILAGVATVLYRQWLARHQASKLIVVANAAPNSVAFVKEKTTPAAAPADQEAMIRRAVDQAIADGALHGARSIDDLWKAYDPTIGIRARPITIDPLAERAVADSVQDLSPSAGTEPVTVDLTDEE